MSKKTISSDFSSDLILNKEKRQKLFHYIREVSLKNWPLDSGLIEDYLKKKMDKMSFCRDVYSVANVLQDRISHEYMVRINKVLRPGYLRNLQLKHIEEFLGITSEIKPYLPEFISIDEWCGTNSAEYGWYGYCKKMSNRLRKNLENIYKSKRDSLNKVREVHFLIQNFYKKESVDRKIVKEIARQLKNERGMRNIGRALR